MGCKVTAVTEEMSLYLPRRQPYGMSDAHSSLSFEKRSLGCQGHEGQRADEGLCECSVTPLSLTLCHPMDCNPPGSPVHRISQARILEWVAISFSRGSSQPRDQIRVTCMASLAGEFFTTEPPSRVSFLSSSLFFLCVVPSSPVFFPLKF